MRSLIRNYSSANITATIKSTNMRRVTCSMHETDMKHINNFRQSPRRTRVSGIPRHKQETNTETDIKEVGSKSCAQYMSQIRVQ